MVRKYLYGLVAFGLAFGILSISLLRSSSVSYALAAYLATPTPIPEQVPEVNYTMVLPGKILPDNVLWPLKAIRDRVLYIFTFDHLKRAELALSLSDKRLVSGQSLFEQKNPALGASTVTKGEKYMEMAMGEEELARKAGKDTSAFLTQLATSSLKHREIIEKNIVPIASQEMRPSLLQLESYSKATFIKASEALVTLGKEAPKNPFDGS